MTRPRPHHRVFSVLAACLALSLSSAAVPEAMNYQGYLTDDAGAPLAAAAPENRSLEFRIFTQGAGGVPVWGEAQTATVFQGNFSVILGNGVAIPGGPLSGAAALRQVFTEAVETEFYIEVALDENPLTPRQALTTAPFAFRAAHAADAGTVGGFEVVGPTGFVLQDRLDPQLSIPVLPASKIAADNSITAAQLAAGAVASEEIADGSVALEDLVAQVANALVPAGTVHAFAGPSNAVPAGYLFCDGAELSRAEWPELFAVIGTTHGATSGLTFNLPDYRGRFLRGDDGGSGRDENRNGRLAMNPGADSGDTVGTVQAGATAMPSDAFRIKPNEGTHSHSFPVRVPFIPGLVPYNNLGPNTVATGALFNSPGGTVAVSGGAHNHTMLGGDAETRPENASVNFIIRTGR